MQLNTAIFEYNGRCGYLLKPELMRRKDRSLDPFTESHLDGVVPATLTIRIISGVMLSFKRVATYVEVDMYGIFGDIDKKNHRCRSDGTNGMNPRYEQLNQPFQFRVTMPEMAYVRICVREERTNKLIGHCLLPVPSIRPGYRHIMLRNEIGQALLSSVFVYLEVRDYIPTFQIDLANALENPIRHQSEHDRKEKLEQLMDLAEDADEALAASEGPEIGDRRIGIADESEVVPLVKPSPTPEITVEPTARSSPAPQPKIAVAPVERIHRESSGASGVMRRGSGGHDNHDDGDANQRFLLISAPTVEDLKNNKTMRGMCRKQDKELLKLQEKYNRNIHNLEVLQAKALEKLILEQEKFRSQCERKNGSMSTPPLGGRTSTTEKDLDLLVKKQEAQRWDLRRRHAEQLAQLRREYYRGKHDLNKRYHEEFYALLENEMRGRQNMLNTQLRAVYDTIVAEVSKKISQDTLKEMRELKARKDFEKSVLEQMTGEVKQKYIRQGVATRKNYETLYEDMRKILAEDFELLAQRLFREKAHVADELDRAYDHECSKLEEEMRKTMFFSDNSNSS